MRRIQRDACHEDFVKSLTTGDLPLFREIWRILLFAAALGIKDGRRRRLEKVESGKAMPETYFSSPGWRGFLFLVGISETGETECLEGTDEAQEKLVTTFEEYANQGLFILRERLQSSMPLDDLTAILLESLTPSIAAPDIEELI